MLLSVEAMHVSIMLRDIFVFLANYSTEWLHWGGGGLTQLFDHKNASFSLKEGQFKLHPCLPCLPELKKFCEGYTISGFSIAGNKRMPWFPPTPPQKVVAFVEWFRAFIIMDLLLSL